MESLYVGVGGFFGAIARYWVSRLFVERFAGWSWWGLPLGTLTVNVMGSFLLALFLAWSSRRVGLPEGLRLLVGTGFFGAYTTFSTFANESFALLDNKGALAGWGYVLLTNGLCLLGVMLGLALAQRLGPSGSM